MHFRIALLALTAWSVARPAPLDVAQLKPDDVKKGVAVLEDAPDFLFAFESDKRPALYIDGQPAGAMKRARPGSPWVYQAKLPTGTSHFFYYMVDGRKV